MPSDTRVSTDVRISGYAAVGDCLCVLYISYNRNRVCPNSIRDGCCDLLAMDSMSNQKTDIYLDVQGLVCPMPLLKAKKTLNTMAGGQVLEVVATDPASARDFEVFACQSGHSLLESREENGVYRHWLRKT